MAVPHVVDGDVERLFDSNGNYIYSDGSGKALQLPIQVHRDRRDGSDCDFECSPAAERCTCGPDDQFCYRKRDFDHGEMGSGERSDELQGILHQERELNNYHKDDDIDVLYDHRLDGGSHVCDPGDRIEQRRREFQIRI